MDFSQQTSLQCVGLTKLATLHHQPCHGGFTAKNYWFSKYSLYGWPCHGGFTAYIVEYQLYCYVKTKRVRGSEERYRWWKEQYIQTPPTCSSSCPMSHSYIPFYICVHVLLFPISYSTCNGLLYITLSMWQTKHFRQSTANCLGLPDA